MNYVKYFDERGRGEEKFIAFWNSNRRIKWLSIKISREGKEEQQIVAAEANNQIAVRCKIFSSKETEQIWNNWKVNYWQ